MKRGRDDGQHSLRALREPGGVCVICRGRSSALVSLLCALCFGCSGSLDTNELLRMYKGRTTVSTAQGVLYRLEDYDLLKSDDTGRNWSRVGSVPARGYPVWGAALSCGADDVLHFAHVGTAEGKKAVYISTSSDGGETWTGPTAVNDDAWAQRTDPTVVAGGRDVFVAWEERSQRDPSDGERPGGIYVTRSRDGGVEWGQDTWMREGEDCWLSLADNGTLYLVYIGGEKHNILYVSYSEDRGKTWRSEATGEVGMMVIREPCALSASGTLYLVFQGARPTFAHLSPGKKLDYQVHSILDRRVFPPG